MDNITFNKAFEILKQRYKNDRSPLHVSERDPFKILVGAILSHRTRDEMTDIAYTRLFKKYKSPAELANANVKDIAKLIKTVGFYRQKAKRIKMVAKIINVEKGGHVPETREELMSLPGVGPKTADIVLSTCFGMPEVAVDTHVETVSKRLGIVSMNARYEEIKKAITSLAPPSDLRLINMLFVRFGREICRKPRPKCRVCPITAYCRYYTEKVKGPIAQGSIIPRPRDPLR